MTYVLIKMHNLFVVIIQNIAVVQFKVEKKKLDFFYTQIQHHSCTPGISLPVLHDILIKFCSYKYNMLSIFTLDRYHYQIKSLHVVPVVLVMPYTPQPNHDMTAFALTLSAFVRFFILHFFMHHCHWAFFFFLNTSEI